MTFTGLLNIKIEIETPNSNQNNVGEIEENYVSKVSNVKSRKVATNSNELSEDIEKTATLYNFYFENSVNIADNDRIKHNGETYDVIKVTRDSQRHHKKALCELIQPQ